MTWPSTRWFWLRLLRAAEAVAAQVALDTLGREVLWVELGHVLLGPPLSVRVACVAAVQRA